MNICFSTEKTANPSPTIRFKRRWLRSARLRLMHTFERCVRILGFKLIKSGFNFFNSRLRFLLVPFVSSAMQVGYCPVQLLQRRGPLLTFSPAPPSPLKIVTPSGHFRNF